MGDESCDVLAREKVKARLNADKIKLWLPPYTGKDGVTREEVSEALAERYSAELSLPLALVTALLEELRQHACMRLRAQQRCRETGLVTLRVRFTRGATGSNSHENNAPSALQSPPTSPQTPPSPAQTPPTSPHSPPLLRSPPSGEERIEISLFVRGLDLRQAVAQRANLPPPNIKLILAGRMVRDELTLAEQGVKNGSQLLALRLSDAAAAEAAGLSAADPYAALSRTREAAEWLSSYADDDDRDGYNLQIADQSGRALSLPAEERKALTLAMMLHERGRSALKRRDFNQALVYLLEADSEFTKCRSALLERVDNYAVLGLDIVWCYLCLQNMAALPDAEVRLKSCEEGFRKSYGPNVERLEIVKGGVGKEKALFMRLHLLQGIAAFYQQRMADAARLLNRADDELKLLKVDEGAMEQVMEMGFSSLEARLGLRTCAGDVQGAVAHIMAQREKRAEQAKAEKKEREKKRLEKKLGKTASGEMVRVEYYDSLASMGYSKGAAAEALRQADNDIMSALQVLNDHPELLSLPDPDPPADFKVTRQMVEAGVALGFDPVSVEAALTYFRDQSRAFDELLQREGVAAHEWLVAAANGMMAAGWSANGSAAGANNNTNSTPELNDEERERRDRLVDEEIRPDLASHEEDYLDLSLDDEEALLHQYQALLASLHQS